LTLALRQRRIGWLLLLFVVLLALGAVRALQLTTVDAAHLSSLGNTEHTATIVVPAARGEITDRNGTILATDEAADDISVTPKLVRDPLTLAEQLAPLIGVSAATIENDIEKPASPDYQLLARSVPAATAARVAALKIPGLALVSDPLRVYPSDDLAAQVLGGVGTDGGGLAGVELEYNRQLAGSAGIQHVVYDAHGQPIACTGDCSTPRTGETVALTIDADMQQAVESVLAQTARKYHPVDETAIVMDLRNNSVLAMANWPGVNANNPSAVGLSRNYAVQLNYEPGSTFKVVAIGGALSDGLISPTTEFSIPNCIQVANYCIHDSEYHPTEPLDTSQILAESSNVGAIKIGELLEAEQPGRNDMYEWMRRYGFGSPTGIDLPTGGNEGFLLPAAQWSGSSIGNMPIGQGVSVTPIQVLDAYAAIANGGILRPPHIVKSVGGVAVKTPAGRRILSPEVARELRSMLEGVLAPGGTAAEIQIPGYTLAGKTGTANKVVGGTYSDKDYDASFVGFAPAQDPQVAALVLVDTPRTGYVYGTEVAAPAWQQIMNFALPYLKIPEG
jgi:cell division protein FtsI (penicillin-binding protein 3)